MTSWDEVRSTHQHLQQSVRIPMRADLLAQIASLEAWAMREQEIDKRENREPAAPGIAAEIQKLEAELAESEVEFTFKALGRRDYAKLLADHPPTDQQKRDAGENARVSYNDDTFPPALMAAACVAPEGSTIEDMTDLWENWSEGQVIRLWSTCLSVNMGSADVGPKSQIASAILGGSAKS